MGILRNFYRYVIREGWLVLTGRKERATAEADGWAERDAREDLEGARARVPYRRYLGEIDGWKEQFDALVSKMEGGDGHRRMAYAAEDLAALPEVPQPMAGTFGFPHERLMDRAAMLKLREETRAWREDRLRQARDRLGLP